jgi:hypothetical protein
VRSGGWLVVVVVAVAVEVAPFGRFAVVAHKTKGKKVRKRENWCIFHDFESKGWRIEGSEAG